MWHNSIRIHGIWTEMNAMGILNRHHGDCMAYIIQHWWLSGMHIQVSLLFPERKRAGSTTIISQDIKNGRGSINVGIPESSTLTRFSIINHPAIGVLPWLWKPPMRYFPPPTELRSQISYTWIKSPALETHSRNTNLGFLETRSPFFTFPNQLRPRAWRWELAPSWTIPSLTGVSPVDRSYQRVNTSDSWTTAYKWIKHQTLPFLDASSLDLPDTIAIPLLLDSLLITPCFLLPTRVGNPPVSSNMAGWRRCHLLR